MYICLLWFNYIDTILKITEMKKLVKCQFVLTWCRNMASRLRDNVCSCLL